MPRFTVAIPERELNKLVEWRAWAIEKGLTSEYLATLKELDYRLEFESDEWGESREYLDGMSVQMRWAACRMVDVLFGVHAESNVVIVKRFSLNRSYKPEPPAD